MVLTGDPAQDWIDVLCTIYKMIAEWDESRAFQESGSAGDRTRIQPRRRYEAIIQFRRHQEVRIHPERRQEARIHPKKHQEARIQRRRHQEAKQLFRSRLEATS